MVSPGAASTNSPSSSKLTLTAVVIAAMPACSWFQRALLGAKAPAGEQAAAGGALPARPCRSSLQGLGSRPFPLELDLDKRIFEGVGIDHIVSDAGLAGVGGAVSQFGETLLAVGWDDL